MQASSLFLIMNRPIVTGLVLLVLSFIVGRLVVSNIGCEPGIVPPGALCMAYFNYGFIHIPLAIMTLVFIVIPFLIGAILIVYGIVKHFR